MPNEDAERWNARYLEDERYHREIPPRGFLVENAAWLPRRGLALDAAMGLGNNAAFLLEWGLRVVGVDVSWVAARQAKRRMPGLMAAVADLTRFHLPAECFDVIVNFYYLERKLWAQYRQALRPGGILVIETLTQEMQGLRPDIEPQYLLRPDELRAAFADWEIMAYREGWVETDTRHAKAVASLVTRRPV
jgi:SAM-dependent methyltransferase